VSEVPWTAEDLALAIIQVWEEQGNFAEPRIDACAFANVILFAASRDRDTPQQIAEDWHQPDNLYNGALADIDRLARGIESLQKLYADRGLEIYYDETCLLASDEAWRIHSRRREGIE